MRKKLIAGNWKMNMTPTEAVELVGRLKTSCVSEKADVLFCVPYTDLWTVREALSDTNIAMGAQNMFYEDKGAYTGEISGAMLKDCGVQYVILGHSERRQYFGETSEIVNRKMKKAMEYGMVPVMCCGEPLEVREAGQQLSFVADQLEKGFEGIDAQAAAGIVIAYEPIWAIGTGRTATEAQAQEVCASIRGFIEERYGKEISDSIRIIYGGSVNGANAETLLAQPDIDGALVGGASLKEEFALIVRAGENC